jgi:hypothetical protein
MSEPSVKPQKKALGVVLIALLSLALALIVSMTGVLLLLDPTSWMTRMSMYWMDRLGFIPHSGPHGNGVPPATWILFSALMVYTVIFVLEGGGMLLQKAWAEYLVLVELALLLPPEMIENMRQTDWLRLLTLIFNIVIFIYLGFRRGQSLVRSRQQRLELANDADQETKGNHDSEVTP